LDGEKLVNDSEKHSKDVALLHLYKLENNKLIIINSPEKFSLKIITKNKPQKNTQLMGLYKSN
jgi:aminopeptidase N